MAWSKIKTGLGNEARSSCGYSLIEGLRRPVLSVSAEEVDGKAVRISKRGSGICREEDFDLRSNGDWFPLERNGGV